jgi:Rrf2 family protein
LQILRSLVTHGILSSTRGVVGGYLLQRRPEDISLLDLIEAIEGPLVGSVPTSPSLSEPTLTKLRKVMDDVAAAKRDLLSRVTMADLLPMAAVDEPAAPRAAVPKRA